VGPIDILVNNAAMNQRKPLEQFTPEEWRALMASNLDGPFLVTRALLPAMKARGRGKIVNVCSLAATWGGPTSFPMPPAKARSGC
jgi:NAD(P)-dependent dehydrogenase (short-subunit alcohol dehydrogenase family)